MGGEGTWGCRGGGQGGWEAGEGSCPRAEATQRPPESQPHSHWHTAGCHPPLLPWDAEAEGEDRQPVFRKVRSSHFCQFLEK